MQGSEGSNQVTDCTSKIAYSVCMHSYIQGHIINLSLLFFLFMNFFVHAESISLLLYYVSYG